VLEPAVTGETLALFTVTISGKDEAALPRLSVAVAVRLCVPFIAMVVFHDAE
jgi:hypothetical protein